LLQLHMTRLRRVGQGQRKHREIVAPAGDSGKAAKEKRHLGCTFELEDSWCREEGEEHCRQRDGRRKVRSTSEPGVWRAGRLLLCGWRGD
jgi:hypothetical protein